MEVWYYVIKNIQQLQKMGTSMVVPDNGESHPNKKSLKSSLSQLYSSNLLTKSETNTKQIYTSLTNCTEHVTEVNSDINQASQHAQAQCDLDQKWGRQGFYLEIRQKNQPIADQGDEIFAKVLMSSAVLGTGSPQTDPTPRMLTDRPTSKSANQAKMINSGTPIESPTMARGQNQYILGNSLSHK